MARRSTRAAPSTQDDIEVDEQEREPSQHDTVHDADHQMSSREGDEEPEQKPLAPSKSSNASKLKSKAAKVKTEKISKSRVRADASDDHRGPDGENDRSNPPFDRDEFLSTAHPIANVGQMKVVGLIRDWTTILHQVEQGGFGFVQESAVAVEEASGGSREGQEAIDHLDLVMRDLVDAQHELNANIASLESLQQRLASGELIEKVEDEYTSHVNDAMEAYGNRTTRQKYAKHDTYFKFRERVWEVNHEDAMPPTGDLIPREEGDESDVESDIEVGGMTQDYKCPLTLMLLTDPLTSKLCDHSYDATAIRDYLQSARGRKPCPASGCGQMLGLMDLEPNHELAKRASNAARRAKRREEDGSDSDGEVVD